MLLFCQFYYHNFFDAVFRIYLLSILHFCYVRKKGLMLTDNKSIHLKADQTDLPKYKIRFIFLEEKKLYFQFSSQSVFLKMMNEVLYVGDMVIVLFCH